VPDCTSANTTAGALGFLGGAGNGSGNGSPIIMRAGTGGAGFGGDAGDLLCEAGTSGGAGSAGGGATFRTGPNSSGNTPGLLLIETPDNTGADAGAATFRTGSSLSVGAGGDLNFITGSGFSSGGNMAFVAGGSAGVGGLISFTPGGGATSESLYLNTPAGPLTEEQPIVHLRNQGAGTGGGEDIQMMTGTSDPTGFAANPDTASLFFRDNAGLGELWIKRGAAASAWEKLGALAYTAGAPKSAAYTAVAGEASFIRATDHDASVAACRRSRCRGRYQRIGYHLYDGRKRKQHSRARRCSGGDGYNSRQPWIVYLEIRR